VTEAQVDVIVRLRARGFKLREIAKRFGVTGSTAMYHLNVRRAPRLRAPLPSEAEFARRGRRKSTLVLARYRADPGPWRRRSREWHAARESAPERPRLREVRTGRRWPARAGSGSDFLTDTS